MRNRLTRGTQWSLVAGAMVVAAAALPGEVAGQHVAVAAALSTGEVVRGDRWTPLVVTVDSAGPSLTGELRVVWGDARVRRPIELASPGRRQFEFLIRTPEPEPTIRVHLDSDGRRMQTTVVAVRVLPPGEPFTLCVLSENGSSPDAACTATTPADRLPRSVRGYEAVDELVWARDTPLSAGQRQAVQHWRALRELERSGDLGLAPQPVRPSLRRGLSEPATQLVAALAAAYVAGLLVTGIVVARRRSGLAAIGAVGAVVAAAGAAAAQALGSLGPGAAIHVHHGSVLHQIPGSSVALFSMRGIIEFPAFDDFHVRLPLSDATIELATAGARAEQVVDESGHPLITGTFGLGTRQAFSAEGAVEIQPLAVTRDGNTTTVTNRSGVTLRSCRFADGLTSPDVGTMIPGASSAAIQVSASLGPVLTCTADSPLVALTAASAAVQFQGRTLVAVYQSRREAAPIDD